MKKAGALILFLTLAILSISIATADVNATCDDGIQNQNETGIDCGEECPACDTTTDTTTTTQQDPDKVEAAFTCLTDKVKGKCSSLTTQEIALTLMASPSEVVDECASALKSKMKTDGSWDQNIKDTALAVLALDHVGEDTTKSEQWLWAQNKTPTDLIWFLEQDSDLAAECTISYDGTDYKVNIAENKKIDSNAGSCLTRAHSNYWFQITPSCLNKEFRVSCSENFLVAKIYQYKNSKTINPLPDSQSEQAYGTIIFQIDSKCFGTSSCNYEETAWAAMALLQTGHNIEKVIPYLIAAAESNEKYLPESFVYIITKHQDSAKRLIKDQETGDFWHAPSSSNSKFYDTSLALLALGKTSPETSKASDWLLFQQDEDGCWENSNSEIIKDTAIVLWALEGRTGATTSGGTTYCSEANYFCIPIVDCPTAEQFGNYFCAGDLVCCQNQHLKTCTEQLGEICSSEEFCDGSEISATDGTCCLGTCEPRSTETECEESGEICRYECLDDEETASYDCETGEVCCKDKEDTEGSSLWWLWVLIVLIILVVLAIIFREKLKMFWYKIKSKFSKGNQGTQTQTGPGPGMPPRPGFPPIRRMPQQRMPMQQRPMPTTRQPRKPIDNTFDKLKQMTGGE